MAIAFVGGAFSTASTTAGTSKTISYTPAAGNTLIVFGFGVGVAISNVTDTAGNVYTRQNTDVTNSVTASIWATAPGKALTHASNVITVTFASSTRNTVVVVEYSGVNAFGTAASNTGSSTTPTISITTHDNNNLIIAGMTRQGTSTWTANVGTLRENQAGPGSTTPGGGVVEHASATPASTTDTATISSSGSWAVQGIELRSIAPISATSTGAGTSSGTLQGKGALASSAAGVAGASLSLSGTGRLVATCAAVATLSATGMRLAQGSSTAAGVSTLSGTLTPPAGGNLGVTIAGQGGLSATLAGRGALAAAAAAAGTMSATVSGRGSLVATAAAVSTLSAHATGKGALAAVAGGAASVLATLKGAGRLAASSAGNAVLTATGKLIAQVAARATGSATVSASATGKGRLVALAQGNSNLMATFLGTNLDPRKWTGYSLNRHGIGCGPRPYHAGVGAGTQVQAKPPAVVWVPTFWPYHRPTVGQRVRNWVRAKLVA